MMCLMRVGDESTRADPPDRRDLFAYESVCRCVRVVALVRSLCAVV